MFLGYGVTTDKARVTIYILQDLKDRLVALAEEDRRSLSVTIELLILQALKEKGK